MRRLRMARSRSLAVCLALGFLLGPGCGPVDPGQPDDDDTGPDDDDTSPDDDDTGPDDDDDDDTGPDDDDVQPVSCDEPWDGTGPRLVDEALERGFDLALGDPEIVGNFQTVVIHDLDDDGDSDVLLGATWSGPHLYANDGQGEFTRTETSWELRTAPTPDWLAEPEDGPLPTSLAIAVLDLDGDGLPELLNSGLHFVAKFPNLGDLAFGPMEILFQMDTPWQVIAGHVFGDINGDQRLDLLVAVGAVDQSGTPDVAHHLLLQDADGNFQPTLELETADRADAQFPVLTDFDQDGDLDLMIPKDQGVFSGLWRNDGVTGEGVPVLVEISDEVGIQIDMHAMGIDSADINGDGHLDYVITDIGPPLLFLGGPAGFIDSGAALGLTPTDWRGDDGTIGWSVDIVDLDNDGRDDIVQASGGYETADVLPDLVWRQTASGAFEDLSEEWGLSTEESHTGLATGDLDGDGFVDVVTGSAGSLPMVFMNRCTEAGWLEVDLVGGPDNREAYGALIKVTVDGSTSIREMHNARARGQGPSVAHFGLGSTEVVDEVEIVWPDGTQTTLTDVERNRRVQVTAAD